MLNIKRTRSCFHKLKHWPIMDRNCDLIIYHEFLNGCFVNLFSECIDRWVLNDKETLVLENLVNSLASLDY